MSEIFEQLSAEFPHPAISWRAQSVTKDGTKAMALAYIDARDVMNRLDQVLGPKDWKDRYEFHGNRTVCYLSIRVDGEWIEKADGAGDSDVEAEKGAISDALKRAAVKWGIGRYLYDMPAPWVPCESAEWNGKKQWKKWTDDPWKYVKGNASATAPDQPKPAAKVDETRKIYADLVADMRRCDLPEDMDRWWKDEECKAIRAKLPEEWKSNLADAFREQKQDLIKKTAADQKQMEGAD